MIFDPSTPPPCGLNLGEDNIKLFKYYEIMKSFVTNKIIWYWESSQKKSFMWNWHGEFLSTPPITWTGAGLLTGSGGAGRPNKISSYLWRGRTGTADSRAGHNGSSSNLTLRGLGSWRDRMYSWCLWEGYVICALGYGAGSTSIFKIPDIIVGMKFKSTDTNLWFAHFLGMFTLIQCECC